MNKCACCVSPQTFCMQHNGTCIADDASGDEEMRWSDGQMDRLAMRGVAAPSNEPKQCDGLPVVLLEMLDCD